MEPASLSSSALSSRFFTLSHLGLWCILPNNWMQQDCKAETFLGDIWLLEGNCGSRTIWKLGLSFFELSHPTSFPCSTEGQIHISLSGLPALTPSLLSVTQWSPLIKSLHIISFLTSVFQRTPYNSLIWGTVSAPLAVYILRITSFRNYILSYHCNIQKGKANMCIENMKIEWT